MGWTLEKSPVLLDLVIKELVGKTIQNLEDTQVYLQRYGKDRGYTDLEIVCPGECHIIVEAKNRWVLPSKGQLNKYANRIIKKKTKTGKVVTLSAADQQYADRRQPREVKGVPLAHRSWADIRGLVKAAYGRAASYREKFWLEELDEHLKEYVSMQNPKDNTVYVVSLSVSPIHEGGKYTWVDVVEKDGSYFHPVGNKWPVEPPNYVGFRYHGELQSVHHIDSYKVIEDISTINKEWPKTNRDHFVYKLGPGMKPARQMKLGRVYPSGRVWCALDTLLSGAFDTLSEARDETNRRLA